MEATSPIGPPCAGLRIGDAAPNFSARSTTGPVDLASYRGQWLILFSHPADFTPVCTTEFVELAKRSTEFAKRDCALMALSVDSLFSHFAWLRLIRDRFDLEVRFPILEDPTLVIGRAYGMVSSQDSDSATVRTTFFIDPEGIIRAMTCYPANVGRSIPEMLRTLDALQAVDQSGELAPANWQVGDRLLHPVSFDLDAIYAADDASSWFLQEADMEKGQ
ncbi:peroxiredoxin [Pacificimonas flava]|uniref:Alkyl hydroperoxide reductase C n=1 Tax=Pacificimonas flava TaxID=1234595 RepID=M2U212_9SPHN|nr:peroxiredoxin [Pacificimonas flava]EMD81833.1 Alkyl hydroperoxide reductase subunit C-like protein [Pacificimonas flava]MBB5281637.1 peroxiredoxin (alkyl hydroperoxide reductase subunit C) [Pacificimonas flava]